jgi:Outer membrane protein beta-barrel domain
MTSKILLRSALIIFVVGVFTATLAAQSVELYPYAGGFWPTRVDAWGDNKLKSEGIYGMKGGVFLTPNAEIEGSFGYINHFGLSRSPNPQNLNPNGTIGQPSAMGFLYDLNGAWNFGQRQFLNTRISPYVSAGVGGLTTEFRDGSAAFLTGGGSAPGPARVLHDHDTFFTVNYGGGIKAMNVWGPMGFRADVRGRTIPNFLHESPSWPEVTGGLLFSWGER